MHAFPASLRMALASAFCMQRSDVRDRPLQNPLLEGSCAEYSVYLNCTLRLRYGVNAFLQRIINLQHRCLLHHAPPGIWKQAFLWPLLIFVFHYRNGRRSKEAIHRISTQSNRRNSYPVEDLVRGSLTFDDLSNL